MTQANQKIKLVPQAMNIPTDQSGNQDDEIDLREVVMVILVLQMAYGCTLYVSHYWLFYLCIQCTRVVGGKGEGDKAAIKK